MPFQLKNSQWVLCSKRGEWPLKDLVKDRSHPVYLYDLDDAVTRAEAFLASGHAVHYAMKANSHPRLLREFARLGLGVDIVSLGEMKKALDCGFSASKIIFSGVAKDTEDIEFAIDRKILQINVESFEELHLIGEVARRKQAEVEIGLRLNIHLAAPTHAYVQTANRDSKFGMEVRQLPEALEWLKLNPLVKLRSLAVHIGSQIQDVSVFAEMGRQMGDLYRGLQARGVRLERLDLGGGLGLDYESDGSKDFALLDGYLKAIGSSHKTDAKIVLDPGRFLVARMGVLLGKVVFAKKTEDQTFLILNTGMHHLMRPALYDSYHRIEPISPHAGAPEEVYTVVGPICESSDKFASGRRMNRAERGDWIAVFDAGAYGAVMASRYNENPWPDEWTILNGKLEA